ncbi:MAG: EAL domain-containing protein [Sulfurimonadaceae bacterium]|jgi:diguanylate cyclase (GGDEF)-like protein|nr:EAL domain-containing protein [Sulfurimonadaceae bacterium]
MQIVCENNSHLKDINILYVDNYEKSQESMCAFLEELQINVLVSVSLQDTLAKYKESHFSIVVVNLISITNGYDIIKELRFLKNEQPVVAIVDEEDAVQLKNSIKLRVDGYIFPPLIRKNIIETLLEVKKIIQTQEQLVKNDEELQKMIEEKSKQFLYESYHDKVTDLHNHFALNDLLVKSDCVYLVLLNIDHFRNINDAYGFELGNNVLRETARYLRMVVPSHIRLFHLSADEFAIVIEECYIKEKVIELLDAIEYFFNESEITLEEGIGVRISFSMGVAFGQGIELLHQAKIALFELREHNRGAYRFYEDNSSYLLKQKNNIYWIHKIKESISEGNLFPYFQPIFNNKTNRIEKYECLARIADEEDIIAPIRFMEAARVTGMLPIITRTMIQQSCEKFANSQYEFSINITSEDLYMDYLEEFLMRNVTRHHIKPEQVVLEILEDITTLNEHNIIEQLHALRKKGFKIAIDDFGSQSSNFSRLLEFSPDYLKIDGAFIKNIIEDEKSRIITEAIVLISHRSNIKVIAEYVHNDEVQEMVRALGIDFSQGYAISEPKKEL